MLERGGQFHATQYAHIPAGNTALGSNLTRQLILIHVAPPKILDGKPPLQGGRRRSTLDSLAYALHVLLIVLEQNVVHEQEDLHAMRVIELP